MKSGKFSAYYKAINYLESLNNISGSYQKTNLASHPNPKIYLERMQDFLDIIGNPEKGFKYIHITGTAGKGSVSSIVHATLVDNDKKSGLFISPFVTSTIEKIKVGEKYIHPDAFVKIIEYLKPRIDTLLIHGRHGMPSYFEIILAIALIYFKNEKCEYVVLEVGLGGRYDATNIIKNPFVTAITNIDLDHTQILGTTTEAIATDKAGIIKKRSHFFTTENNQKILIIFKNTCKKVGASYTALDSIGLSHNEKNLSLASSICIDIGIIKKKNDVVIPKSIPARFEIVESSPVVIVDGAHNVLKIQSTIDNLKCISYNKLSAIIAISADKDWKSMLKNILPYINTLYITRFSVSGRSCVNPKEMAYFAKKHAPKKYITCYTDPIQAFLKARKALGKKDALLITGSFYLAGDIRGLYCSEDKVLKQRNSKIYRRK